MSNALSTTAVARNLEREARGWRRYADQLADFADAHLVNRRDVWGLRTPAGESYTLPAKVDRGKVFLTTRDLRDHFAGQRTYGLHASDGTTSKWCGVDFDNHDDSAETAAANITAAAALCAAQRLAGAFPLIEDSDGGGGLHVLLFFDSSVSTYDLFQWLDGLRSSLGLTGETFPKQAIIERYGNWLRLPGKHHRRPHWSRIAKDGHWLAGEDAARALLTHPLTPASVIPPAPLPRVLEPADPYPLPLLPHDRAALIEAYIAKVPHGGVGSDRSKKAFTIGRFLRGVGVGDTEALAYLHDWNRGNDPPIGEAKLLETWKNSARYNNRQLQRRAPAAKDAFARLPRSRETLDASRRFEGPSLLEMVGKAVHR